MRRAGLSCEQPAELEGVDAVTREGGSFVWPGQGGALAGESGADRAIWEQMGRRGPLHVRRPKCHIDSSRLGKQGADSAPPGAKLQGCALAPPRRPTKKSGGPKMDGP
ncbi:hypothetical protein MTO96_041416 [Rhipicephalus appendiculatus]